MQVRDRHIQEMQQIIRSKDSVIKDLKKTVKKLKVCDDSVLAHFFTFVCFLY